MTDWVAPHLAARNVELLGGENQPPGRFVLDDLGNIVFTYPLAGGVELDNRHQRPFGFNRRLSLHNIVSAWNRA
jgi:hypothetical protein